jgi:chitinase
VVNSGYTTPLETRKALNYLAGSERLDGSYRLQDPVRNAALRVIMTWSINWDAAGQHRFSSAIRSCLNSLP